MRLKRLLYQVKNVNQRLSVFNKNIIRVEDLDDDNSINWLHIDLCGFYLGWGDDGAGENKWTLLCGEDSDNLMSFDTVDELIGEFAKQLNECNLTLPDNIRI